MATIGDVAREAGVSRSTASYALSGKRPISEEVRRRVLAAAEALAYTPNAGARALATSRTKVLGLLARFYTDEFAPAMMQYIQGVTDTARDLGYDTLLVTDEDGARALRRITDSRMVDGVVLMNIAQDDPRLPILRAAAQPGATVGLPGDCSGIDVFDLDFEEAGRAMVDHLHGLGHRELILISQPEHVVERGGAYVWRLRDAALERARQCGVTLHTVYGESRQPAVGRLLHTLLDTYPSATGLLINNEAAAAALPSVAHERGLRVPEDLSVIGRYSAEFAAAFSLPYSFVESAPDRLGSMAVRQLVRRVESAAARREPFVVRFISPELVSRGSTTPPREPHPRTPAR
ncbi:LacI family DNA-binding transcriptional regulator [Nonomuraea rhodomycinica]|uniref:LacI family DNA-binding transcriptional regulator n=1 Tax=Nonomuraea rhodomycinica TaxID=1712872 RepID=A0A7Y6MFQ8_9ACTN|nr:LacI family DNA-binding transcriptional regulator [Nonomuraea rhodomycinica]NUW44926.1 LacI family DNA-binding transcriptional regulator [Nonomuraea rhodomycinica]